MTFTNISLNYLQYTKTGSASSCRAACYSNLVIKAGRVICIARLHSSRCSRRSHLARFMEGTSDTLRLIHTSQVSAPTMAPVAFLPPIPKTLLSPADWPCRAHPTQWARSGRVIEGVAQGYGVRPCRWSHRGDSQAFERRLPLEKGRPTAPANAAANAHPVPTASASAPRRPFRLAKLRRPVKSR